MAIRIPILTSFDPKGLKQANAQFAKLQSSVGSLGRNFAVAGTAIVAGTALLGKAVQSASNFEAEFEGVNQVFGEAAKSVQKFAEQAAQSAGLSATEALQASKTFGLFATGAGLGVEEAAKFSTTMVQLAGDLGSFNDVPTAEALAAIQSGLMGQSEPLRKFGVFLDDARLKAEALNMGIYNGTGPLSTQQKMMASYSAILSQTTVQQGDFVKYQDTLGNQLKTISTEFDNLSKDIGLMLIPAITEAMPEIKEMARQLGTQLKTAIASVDWKALTKTIVDLAKFFSENAGTIIQVVTAIFALNTAYKLMQVAIGITNVALALNKWWLAQVATGMTTATIAAGKLRTALLLIGVVAAVAAVVTEYIKLKGTIEKSTTALSDFDTEVIAVSGAAAKLSPINTMWQKITYSILGAITAQKEFKDLPTATTVDPRAGSNYAQGFRDRLGRQAADSDANALAAALAATNASTTNTGGSASSQTMSLAETLKREATVVKKQAKLVAAGVSEGLAARLTAGAAPVKRANKALAAITKNNGKLTKNLRNMEKNLKVVADAAVEAVTTAEEPIKDTSVEDALAAKQRAYESFADAVKNTFGSIKDSILGAFNLTELGSSTNSITRNMDKMLVKLRSFATNVAKLSGLGLNSALLQQVISAGPMAGARLAENLVMGGAEGLAAINAGYSEFGSLAGQIATTGTNSLFNREAQQTVYNINVDGGVGSGSTIGKAIVDAIKAYERTSGAVWQGA
jgi:hypothetical protein